MADDKKTPEPTKDSKPTPTPPPKIPTVEPTKVKGGIPWKPRPNT